ncbi:hypothetical protein ACFV6E_22755 [Streptomyces sp. NPDC059785]
MTIEPLTELGTGDALRLPRARVVPLSAPPSSYTGPNAGDQHHAPAHR